MRTHFLLLLLLLIIVTITHIHAFPEWSPEPEPPTLENRDNTTIHNFCKESCSGCTDESLLFLFLHNLLRVSKGLVPLIWDSKLESYAKWWASQRQKDCKLEHSSPDGSSNLGENIFWGSGVGWTAADAVKGWVGEEQYYKYEDNSCVDGQMCGHYTQVVWGNTRRMGCATVKCSDGNTFMTCNYDPPGNYFGEKPY